MRTYAQLSVLTSWEGHSSRNKQSWISLNELGQSRWVMTAKARLGVQIMTRVCRACVACITVGLAFDLGYHGDSRSFDKINEVTDQQSMRLLLFLP